MSELNLKGWLVNALHGVWCDTISPGTGSTVGFPDVGMLVPGTLIYMLVELKLAEAKWVPEKNSGRLFNEFLQEYEFTTPAQYRIRPARLRPSQIAWHEGFSRAGGYSRLVIGIMQSDGWQVWVLDRPRVEQLGIWKAGFPERKLVMVAKDGKLNQEDWWRGPREYWQRTVDAMAPGQSRHPSGEPVGALKMLPS